MKTAFTNRKNITLRLRVKFLHLLMTASLLIAFPGFSQNNDDFCASDAAMEKRFTDDPALRAKQEAIESQLFQLLNGRPLNGSGQRQIYTIPVVVHIIHNGGSENISDAQVQAGIQHMNHAFRNLGGYTLPYAADVEIEFCLASQDPAGATTNGITRTQSALTDVTMETEDDALKNLSRWDPTKYFNIWVVKEIRSSSSAGAAVAGYANLPFSHGFSYDGVVSEARYFGVSERTSKVHIHEAGHYLGLYHTFQNGCQNNNCLTQGDRVCDTPPDNLRSVIGCTQTINSCTSDDDDLSANNPFRPVANGGIGDQNDMFLNFMDYGNTGCTPGAFTQGQKNRMVAAITGIRSSLLASDGCQSPCPAPVAASFTASGSNVSPGALVTFTNTSTGATTYNWLVNGVSFATTVNASYTFSTAGVYTVTLTASNNSPSCTQSTSKTIVVSCGVQAAFTASSTQVNPGASVTFTNASTGAISYQWFVDNVAVATTANYTRTFATPGIYEIKLSAAGACTSTSTPVYIQVGSCSRSASKRANFWFFGYRAGLDFNSGSPVAVSGSRMFAGGHVSTISDTNGQLLFYTNGDSIWNRNHRTMPNGFIDNYRMEAPRGLVIIPHPGNSNQYYVFNFRNVDSPANSIRYHLVDMTLDNGKGDKVLDSAPVAYNASEPLLAIPHANGRDYWLMVKNLSDKNYYAFLISPAGISATPVVSQNVSNFRRIHENSVSLNFNKIASHTYNGGFEICNFNNATGIVSPYHIHVPDSLEEAILLSPAGTKLYVGYSGLVAQYDLTAGSSAAIANTRINISGTYYPTVSNMQHGPDGKIYICAGGPALPGGEDYHLQLIENPELPGIACGYTRNAVHLGGGYIITGLPNFPADFLAPGTANASLSITGSTAVTEGTWAMYGISQPYDPGSVYTWTVNGNATIQSQSNTTITLDFITAGTATLIMTRMDACAVDQDTIIIHIAPMIELYIGSDTAFCSSNSIVLNAGSGFAAYLWQNGSTAQTLTVTSTGTYWVRATTLAGYTTSDTLRVFNKLSGSPTIDNGGISSICPGNIAVLNAGDAGFDYTWQDGWKENTYTAYLPGTYSVTVADLCGNTATDEITIEEDVQHFVDFGADTMHCGKDITLTAPEGYLHYTWQDGSSDASYIATEAGIYSVLVTKSDGCMDSDTIEVQVCTGITPVNGFDFTLYPNPAQTKINVSIPSLYADSETTIELLNALGKQVILMPYSTPEVDISGLAPGVYFVCVTAGKYSALKKFVAL